jgi:DNA-binding response OmpR family regulator
MLVGDSVVGSTRNRQLILLVDDDQRILHFARVKLMASGYDVVTAMTGHGALTMIESQEPDIMVLDIMMPGMGGLEVLKALRNCSQLPVIVISAATDCAEEAVRLGANAFVSKPFNPDELVGRIESILAG